MKKNRQYTGTSNDANNVNATDTSGIIGAAGSRTTVQALLNKLAAKFVNKDNVVNSTTTTEAGYVLDARVGRTLSTQISSLTNGITSAVVTNRVLCAGTITTSTKHVVFFVPYATIASGVINNATLSLCVRLSSGGYPWVRSGSSGETYNQLTFTYLSILNNGTAVRSNEVESVEVRCVHGQGIFVDIGFVYAICAASGSTTAVTNNQAVIVQVQLTGTVTT